MHPKSPEEVAKESYEQSRSQGKTHEEAMVYAMHDRGDMGFIYGSLMTIPVKVILLVAFFILIKTSLLDGFTSMQKFAIVFGAVWAWWFIAVVFVIKLRSLAGWIIYAIMHMFLGFMVLHALMSS